MYYMGDRVGRDSTHRCSDLKRTSSLQAELIYSPILLRHAFAPGSAMQLVLHIQS